MAADTFGDVGTVQVAAGSRAWLEIPYQGDPNQPVDIALGTGGPGRWHRAYFGGPFMAIRLPGDAKAGRYRLYARGPSSSRQVGVVVVV